jgi:hypothetical protein
MSDVHFKFRDDAAADDRDNVIARLSERGVHPKRLFPEEEEGELANLYGVECDAEERARVLDELTKNGAVEFAERVVQRKLIR